MTVHAYSRVSSTGAKATRQDTAAQVAQHETAGYDRLWDERGSGARFDRPVMREMLATAVEGDVIQVVRLDRLGRSLLDLLTILADLDARGIKFRSLTESIDSSTAAGKLALSVLAAAGEYERSLLRERILASREATGKRGGRPRSLTDANLKLARRMLDEGTPAIEVARQFGCHKATLYRALAVADSAERRSATGGVKTNCG